MSPRGDIFHAKYRGPTMKTTRARGRAWRLQRLSLWIGWTCATIASDARHANALRAGELWDRLAILGERSRGIHHALRAERDRVAAQKNLRHITAKSRNDDVGAMGTTDARG